MLILLDFVGPITGYFIGFKTEKSLKFKPFFSIPGSICIILGFFRRKKTKPEDILLDLSHLERRIRYLKELEGKLGESPEPYRKKAKELEREASLLRKENPEEGFKLLLQASLLYEKARDIEKIPELYAYVKADAISTFARVYKEIDELIRDLKRRKEIDPYTHRLAARILGRCDIISKYASSFEDEDLRKLSTVLAAKSSELERILRSYFNLS